MTIEQISDDARRDLSGMIEFLDDKLGAPTPIRPDGFGITVREYMTEKKCSENTARAMLDRGVKNGILERMPMIVGNMGGAPMVYFQVGAWK